MQFLKNPFVLAILGGVLVGVAIALNLMLQDDDLIEPITSEVIVQQSEQAQSNIESPPEIEVSPTAPENEVVAQPQSTQPAQLTELDVVTEPSQVASVDAITSQVESQTETPVAAQDMAPAFDVVRITIDGHAVIAGKAEHDSNVKVLINDELLGAVSADKHGEWVYVPSNPLDPGTHRLSLQSSTANGVVVNSDQTVLINVPERNTDKADESFAVVVSADPAKPTQILQKPGEPSVSLLSIDAIDYNKDGEFSITGTAKANSLVNVYLDNTYIGTSQTTNSGQWFLQPETRVKPGQYQLRADQVDDKGDVLERITMPFVRDELKPNIDPDNYYVVQPGNSLWRIARGTYGEGMQYTVIYMANKDQIGNPDMIFPGQIFSLPEN